MDRTDPPAKQGLAKGFIKPILLRAASLFLCFLALGPVLVFCFWLVYGGTARWRVDAYWRTFPPDFGCDDTQLVDGCEYTSLWYLWLLVVVATLASILILQLTSFSAHAAKASPRRLVWLRRWGSYQLVPRRFWAWWCGGLNVHDAVAVLTWLAINATWMYFILHRYFSVFAHAAVPGWKLKAIVISVALGQLLFPNLAVLFFPISRGSVLLQVSRISFPVAIKYHRWLGHFAMLLVSAHSLGFWAIWLLEGPKVWMSEAFDQGSRINNLMGGLSFLFSLALWISSLEFARRTNYDVFYKLHHVGFWGFMLFGCMHFWNLYWYFLPGLLLYAVDAAHRLLHVGQNRAEILQADATSDDRVATLLLRSPAWATAATGYIWLHAPDISRTQWHPFEYVAVSGGPLGGNGTPGSLSGSPTAAGPRSDLASSTAAAAPAAPPAMLVSVKAYDRWTAKLVSLVQQRGTGLSIWLEGPYAELPPPSSPPRDAGLVLVAGGVGVTAALSVLAELPLQPQQPALLIWSVRQLSELIQLGPAVFSLARHRGLALKVSLFYTGSAVSLAVAVSDAPDSALALDSTYAGLDAVPRSGSFQSSSGGGTRPGSPWRESQGQTQAQSAAFLLCDVAEPPRLAAPGSVSCLCPVLALGRVNIQGLVKAAAHAATFAGALAAMIGVRYVSTVLPARRGDEAWSTAAAGAAYVGAIAAGAVLPALTLLAAARALQDAAERDATGGSAAHARSRRRSGANSVDPEKRALLAPLIDAEAGATARVWTGSGNGAGAMRKPGLANSALPPLKAPPLAAATAPLPQHLTAPPAARFCATPQAVGEGQVCYPVSMGRPDVRGLLQQWLTVEFSAAAGEGGGAGGARCVAVYGMGPERLVEEAQLACHDLNFGRSGRGCTTLLFTKKTHAL